MRYILLNNGTGVFRRDATRIKTKRIEFLFEGAPERCEVRFKNEGMTISMPLNNGEVTLDASKIRGTVEVTVVSNDKRWKCDALYIGECKSGELFITTKACYGEKIASLTRDVEELRKEVNNLRKSLLELKKEAKITKTYNEII